MSFKKFKADKLFDGHRFHGDDKVLIADEDGTIKDIVSITDAGDDVQKLNGILSPGLINCHCHLELSHMKGLIPKHTGLVNFVMDIMGRRNETEKNILDAISRAEDEMLNNGIVAVGDICNKNYTIRQKKKSRREPSRPEAGAKSIRNPGCRNTAPETPEPPPIPG